MLPKDGKLHYSTLKHIGTSPAHYASACESDSVDSTTFRVGRAVHAWILQGIEPVVYTGSVRRGKEWDAFCESATVHVSDILNESEYEIVKNCVKSVAKNLEAQKILSKCDNRETLVNWHRRGIPCSGRIDAHSDEYILEIKTTGCAKPRKFLYDAHKFCYHAQTAWYDVALGTIPSEFTKWRKHVIVAVETKAPFITVVYELDNLRIDQGHLLCEQWLDTYEDCLKNGFDRGYADQQPVLWDAEIIVSNDDDEEEN